MFCFSFCHSLLSTLFSCLLKEDCSLSFAIYLIAIPFSQWLLKPFIYKARDSKKHLFVCVYLDGWIYWLLPASFLLLKSHFSLLTAHWQPLTVFVEAKRVRWALTHSALDWCLVKIVCVAASLFGLSLSMGPVTAPCLGIGCKLHPLDTNLTNVIFVER